MPIPHLPVEIVRLVLDHLVQALSAARYDDRFAVMELATVCKSWSSVVVDAVLSRVEVSVDNIEWLVPALLERSRLCERMRMMKLDHKAGGAAMPPEERARLLQRIMFPAEDDPLVRVLAQLHHLTEVEVTVLLPNLFLLGALERAGVLPRLRILRLFLCARGGVVLAKPARAAIFVFLSQCHAVGELELVDVDDYLAKSHPTNFQDDNLLQIAVVRLATSSVSDPSTAFWNLFTCIDPAALLKLELYSFPLTDAAEVLGRCTRLQKLDLSFGDRDAFDASWPDLESLLAKLAALRYVTITVRGQTDDAVENSPVPLAAVCDAVEAHGATILISIEGLVFALPEHLPAHNPAVPVHARRPRSNIPLVVRIPNTRPTSTRFRIPVLDTAQYGVLREGSGLLGIYQLKPGPLPPYLRQLASAPEASRMADAAEPKPNSPSNGSKGDSLAADQDGS